ncbi:anti-anti-sigma factor [Streptacidiphilus sp. MAP12-16]|uniref:STAS domain-containing protein n=1 Tax=Streptacidiphilus sp. MAP12-16 TaxID=3156300 RepID=UPI003518A84D
MSGDFRLVVLVLGRGSMAQILLAGELDLDAGPELELSVAQLLEDPQVRRIEIDVALVEFCDAGGLSALLTARKQAHDRQVPLYLIQIRAALRKVLDAAGLDQLLGPPD